MNPASSENVIPLRNTRRFSKDCWHPYGWKVSFAMSIRFPSDGHIERRHFSDIGVDRWSAIGNAERQLTGMYPR